VSTFKTYDQVGIKEDISDIISNISPTKTPFQTSIGSESVKSTTHKWQEDDLRAVAANAQVEGFTAVSTAREPTAYVDNVTQILQETFNVSGTADVVSTYGRAKESAYQAAKVAAALKRDLEHAFVGTEQTQVDGDSATARVMAGAQALIHADLYTFTGGTSTLPTETNLLTTLQELYEEGSEPTTIMVTPTNARTVMAWAAATGRERDMGDSKKIVNAVEVYVSPYGSQKIVLNRFLKAKQTLIYDPDMWKKLTLRPWFRETLAKTGDNVTMMMVGEFSLKHKNQRASAIIEEAAS
jgi:post-segregation antitoxin (ccd killing protein)